MRPARRIAALLAAVMFAACSGTGSLSRTHVLRIADVSDPNSLNPLLAHDQDTIGWDLLYVQTLVGLDARNTLVPILVTRIPTRADGGISRDGKTITYHLRPARFADGEPFTSRDVAFTYHAILDPHNNVLSQDAYRRIVSLQTPDLHTVVIRLREPWNAATSVLFAQADFAFGILPAHAFTSRDVIHSAWEEHAFGTGPFRVVQWRRGDRVILERNPYFSPKPKLARIVLKMIPDTATAFVALRTREVDVAGLTPDELAPARSLPGLLVRRTPENATIWFDLQTQAPPTNDLRVRRAIGDAIDLDAMRKAYDYAYEPAGSFLPPVFRHWYDASIRPRKRDLHRAAAELGGRPFDVVLVGFAGRQPDGRIATLAQAQLAAIGIRVTIKLVSLPLFNAPEGPARNGRFSIALSGWLGGADPEQSAVFSCSQVGANGNNISRFCNAEMERLYTDQSTTADDALRRADFVAMQRLVRADVPIIPLYYESYFDGMSGHVTGFERNMLRYPVNAQNWDVR